ncbi:16 kDa calcium-binding protein [Biomphalaria glabrata]|nr:16 kDa calcium-binding protein [Biomphalaria glabrata]
MSSILRFFRRKKDSSKKKDSSPKKDSGGKNKKDKKHKGNNECDKTDGGVQIPEITQDTRRLFYAAEFKSLGDVTKDNTMRKEEFTRLMMLLGFPYGIEEIEQIWSDKGMEDGGRMSLEEYIDVMLDDKIDSQTSMWRKLFTCFDTDGNATASKAEVVKGLEKIGLDITPEMRTKIDQMDTNKDGKISYEEFLKAQLKQ